MDLIQSLTHLVACCRRFPQNWMRMMSLLQGKEEIVRKSLSEFIQNHLGEASLSVIDDIVLTYVVSILEELDSQDSAEEGFDVADFTEMMSAYFPQFGEVNSAVICEWMFDLSAHLSKLQEKVTCKLEDLFMPMNIASIKNNEELELHKEEEEEEDSYTERSYETSDDNDSHESGSSKEDDEKVKLLQEMFPTACTLELQHCLCIAEGVTEKAAQLILHRQEAGESIVVTLPRQPHKCLTKVERNDNELRQHILSRYMYVDQSEDKKEHKPVAPKWEPKKLVRYRNNQIVSLKGEKYTEVKETESEDMKKTYVTLKPSRQYRFH